MACVILTAAEVIQQANAVVFRLIYTLSKVRKNVWMFSIASNILYLHSLQKQNGTRIENNKT